MARVIYKIVNKNGDLLATLDTDGYWWTRTGGDTPDLTLASMTDVSLAELEGNDILVYDADTETWVNTGQYRVAYHTGWTDELTVFDLTNAEYLFWFNLGDQIPTTMSFDLPPTIVADQDPLRGSFATLQLATIAHGQTTTATWAFDWTTAPRDIEIRYHLESEEGCDIFKVKLDGDIILETSGMVGWNSLIFPVSTGLHTIIFEYTKDYSVNSGFDNVRIGAITAGDSYLNTTKYNIGDIVRYITDDITMYYAPIVNMPTTPPTDNPFADPLEWIKLNGFRASEIHFSQTTQIPYNNVADAITGAYNYADTSMINLTNQVNHDLATIVYGAENILTGSQPVPAELIVNGSFDYLGNPLYKWALYKPNPSSTASIAADSNILTYTVPTWQNSFLYQRFPAIAGSVVSPTRLLVRYKIKINATICPSIYVNLRYSLTSASVTHLVTYDYSTIGSDLLNTWIEFFQVVLLNTNDSRSYFTIEGSSAYNTPPYTIQVADISVVSLGNDSTSPWYTFTEPQLVKLYAGESIYEKIEDNAMYGLIYQQVNQSWLVLTYQNLLKAVLDKATVDLYANKVDRALDSTITGLQADAVGTDHIVSGSRAFAMGNSHIVSGEDSFAAGTGNIVLGEGAAAFGIASLNAGSFSVTENFSNIIGSGWQNDTLAMYSKSDTSVWVVVPIGMTIPTVGELFWVAAIDQTKIPVLAVVQVPVVSIAQIGINNMSAEHLVYARQYAISFDLANLIAIHPGSKHRDILAITKHQLGIDNTVYSHAEGTSLVTGDAAHAEGTRTTAGGHESHAEGLDTFASAGVSHAEGDSSYALGYASHAEGISTQATEDAAHAEGTRTIAAGDSSHAEGIGSIAIGHMSHAANEYTIAAAKSQTVIGKYNIADYGTSETDAAFIIGNGDTTNTRSNAFVVNWDGSVVSATGKSLSANNYTNEDKALVQTIPDILSDKSYIHNQMSASASWVITHNMNKFPSVHIVNNFNEVVIGDIAFNSVNQITLTFSGPFSGKAYLN